MDDLGTGTCSDLVARGLPFLAIVIRDADLDQFVGGERPIDFSHNRIGHARAARLHDRFECVCSRLQMRAFARRQGLTHTSLYAPARC